MKYIIVSATLCAGLAGCTEPLAPLGEGSNIFSRGTGPLYAVNTQTGTVLPTSCTQIATNTIVVAAAPSGCLLDTVIARQVANPRDLTDPQQPGNALSAPVASAAFDYLYGDGPGAAGGAAGGNDQPQRIDVAPGGAVEEPAEG